MKVMRWYVLFVCLLCAMICALVHEFAAAGDWMIAAVLSLNSISEHP